jgi:hypothetical protein
VFTMTSGLLPVQVHTAGTRCPTRQHPQLQDYMRLWWRAFDGCLNQVALLLTWVVIEVTTREARYCCKGCEVHVGVAERKDVKRDLR